MEVTLRACNINICHNNMALLTKEILDYGLGDLMVTPTTSPPPPHVLSVVVCTGRWFVYNTSADLTPAN